MDVVWDQDVRTILAAIISSAPAVETIEDTTVTKHVKLAIRYADELNKARNVLERKPPVQQYRPSRGR